MTKWFLPALMLVFVLLSVLTLRSVAPSLATQQLIFFCLGGVIFFSVSRFSYAEIDRYNWLAYGGLIILLIIPLMIGKTTRGIAGWIDIGTLFSIQPSQLAIPIVSLVIAKIVAQDNVGKWQILAQCLILIGIPAGLIVIEPDLGTTIVYLAALGSLLYVSPTKWQHLAVLAGVGLIGIILSWNFLLKPYQKARITSFMASSQDTSGASYNAQQALIAVGSGQLIGRGLGQGVQSHLRFLPERQTDFIFASLAEELGFVGTLLVLSLYIGLVGYCLMVWQRALPHPEAYYALSAGIMTAVQAGINMGMNMSLFPITGITLPLLSYGGSSILAISGMYGVVWGISQRLKRPKQLHVG